MPMKKKSIIRAIFTGKLFLIAVFTILIYTLSGFFLLPYILKSQLKKYVANDLNRTLQVEKIRLNPYVMTLEISDLALKEADGEGILAFNRFFIDFELKSLFRWAWTFADISLDGLVLQVDVAPDKSINLDRLVQNISPKKTGTAPSKPTADTRPPRLYFKRIQLLNGHVHIRDRSQPTPAEIPIEPINLEITDLTTLPEKKGPHRIVAQLPHHGTLEWSGQISLQPIWSEGQFKLKNIHTKIAWDFLKETLKIETPEGILGLEGHYWFDYTTKTPRVKISDLNMQLDNLTLKVLNTQNAALAMDTIRVENGRFDLANRDMTVGRLTLSGGSLSAAVEKSGRLSWENIITTKPQNEPANTPGTSKNNAPPFKIHMENIALRDMGIKFEDHSRLHPLGMDLENFGISFQADVQIFRQKTQAIINEMGLDVKGLMVRQLGEPEELLALPKATIRGGQVDLNARRVLVKAIAFEGGNMAVWRTREGDINLVRLTASGNEGAIRREIAKVKEAAENEQHPWSVHLEKIQMEKFGMQLSDRSLKVPERYGLQNINLNVTDFQSPPKAPFNFNLDLDIVEGGTAAIKGLVDMQAPSVALSIKADDVALTPLKPYLNQFLIPSLDSGNLFVKGDVNYRKDKDPGEVFSFKGGGGIKKLALIRPENGKTFLAWNLLDINGIQFNTVPGEMRVEEVLLDHLKSQFVIKKDGSLDLKKRPGHGPKADAKNIAPEG